MNKETRKNDFDTLLEAISSVKEEGFTVEFICQVEGLLDPVSNSFYISESISKMEVIRIESPLSEPDEESVLYLFETKDGKKGWISDSYGYNSNQGLSDFINRIENYLIV